MDNLDMLRYRLDKHINASQTITTDCSCLGQVTDVFAELRKLRESGEKLLDLNFGFMEQNRKLREILHHAYGQLLPDGCDCGTDEPGSCALCEIEEALELRATRRAGRAS